ncbi:MAG TPA: hypothetical protein VMU17_07580 [Elusimicrobiota bacterium]|nr:hypothetical protein [Elusimicrobiota bacterium]
MNRRGVALCMLTANLFVLTSRAADNSEVAILKSGSYKAGVVAIPCEACPPVIVSTLRAQKGITDVVVDQKTSTVQFRVQPGSSVKLANLQTALKAASDEMGMDADYRLKNVNRRTP